MARGRVSDNRTSGKWTGPLVSPGLGCHIPWVNLRNWRPRSLNTTQRCWLLLGATLLLHVNLWQLWLAQGNVAQGCDVFAHLNHQLHFADTLHSFAGDPSLDGARRLLSAPEIAPAKWPRFTYLVSSVGTALVGRGTRATVLFTNTVFTLVLLLSLFSLGRRLFGIKTALLGCVLFTFFPYTMHFANSYGLDYPLAAMVTLSWAALVRTEGFRCRRWSILFAVALALTLLTKVQGVLFLIGPMIYVALRELRRRGARATVRREVVGLNLVLSGSIAVIILGLLLPGSLWSYVSTFLYHTGDSGMPATMVTNPLSLQSVLFYPVTLALGVSPWILVLALVGLGRAGARQRGFVLVALITPLLIFVFVISTKWQRFLLPATPLLALAAADALLRFKRPAVRAVLVPAVLLLSTVQLGVMGFQRNLYSPVQAAMGRAGLRTTNSFAHPPERDNYHEQAGKLVKLLRGRMGPTAPLELAIIEDPAVGAGAAVVLQYMIRLFNGGGPVTIYLSGQRPGPFIAALGKFNQLIVLSNRWIEPSVLLRKIYRRYLNKAKVARAWPRNRFDYRSAEVRRGFAQARLLPELMRMRLKPLDIKLYVLGATQR